MGTAVFNASNEQVAVNGKDPEEDPIKETMIEEPCRRFRNNLIKLILIILIILGWTLFGITKSKLDGVPDADAVNFSNEQTDNHFFVPSSNVCSGTTETIECSKGNVIIIRSAWYGRQDSSFNATCKQQNVIGTDCGVNVIRQIRFSCQETRMCHLTATDELSAGSNCSDIPQNLRVTYTCTPYISMELQPTKSSVTPDFTNSTLLSETVPEGQVFLLDCGYLALYIQNAVFGADGCFKDAKKLLSFNCDGNSFCIIRPTIGTFGNLCGAKKRLILKINYYCEAKVNKTLTAIPPIIGLPKTCGRRTLPRGRVIDGVKSKPGLWPWQAAIYKGTVLKCGGSLINSNWIVTAAHCFGNTGDNKPDEYTVVLGDYNRNINEGYEHKYNVKKIIVHDGFDSTYIDKDFALMEITLNVAFTDYISPVCVPDIAEKNTDYEEKCVLTGWGTRTFLGYPSYILQQGSFEVVDTNACQEKANKMQTRRKMKITDYMLCAHNTANSDQSACKGDSGGPFVCYRKNNHQWYLRGVVSWGSARCNTRDMYDVLGKISQVRDWINETINKL